MMIPLNMPPSIFSECNPHSSRGLCFFRKHHCHSEWGSGKCAVLNLDGTLTINYEFTTAGYNSPPIADDQTVITFMDTPVEITLTAC
jgi:hypothetical protein